MVNCFKLVYILSNSAKFKIVLLLAWFRLAKPCGCSNMGMGKLCPEI